MMLCGIAIGHSVLSLLLLFSVNNGLIRPCFFSIDFCVNLWCMYLQFAFAETSYQRCCGWCDIRCKRCGLKRSRKIIYKHSNQLTVTPASKQPSNQFLSVQVDGSV